MTRQSFRQKQPLVQKQSVIVLGAVFCVVLWLAAGFVQPTTVAQLQSAATSETFEAGGKTAYSAANVSLSSGGWYFDDALTGNLSSDRKTGAFSARLRNAGVVRMNLNAQSAGTVTVQHAVYGSDGASTWELWKSVNNGAAWSKVGATVTANSQTLTTASFPINYGGAIRFELRKVSGGANRLNFDNFQVSAYTAPTPTPTPSVSPSQAPTASPSPTAPPITTVHLALGNPSNAQTNAAFTTNYLLVKNQYALSYHRDNKTPNWTAWHLDSSWIGSTPRQDDFRPDATLPSGWYRVTGSDYSGSGFDRGHMTPSGDRTGSVTNNSATFLMTNIIPQAPDNNQGPWADLENYTRTLVSSGANEVYVVSGGYGVSGYIGSAGIAVPTATWKAIVVLPKGAADAARVTNTTRIIGIWMPNQQGIRHNDWQSYRVSVDYIEAITGYNLFDQVNDAVENQIEARVDDQ